MYIDSFYAYCSSVPCNLHVVFSSVPSDLVESVSLTPVNATRIVGSSIDLTCTAMLSTGVSGAKIVFDYGFDSNMVTASANTAQASTTTISPVSISSARSYTCTVTVTASGVCGGSTCPTMTSGPIHVTVLSECVCMCVCVWLLVFLLNFFKGRTVRVCGFGGQCMYS